MAAVYFLGYKEVSTKKGEKDVAFFLAHDVYGSPAVRSFWLNQGQIPELYDVMPGAPVRCTLDMSGNLATISEFEDDRVPLLDLTAYLDNSL